MEQANYIDALEVNRAEIFASILPRQVLRREARLPLLNVRIEYRRAVEQALWSAYVNRHYAGVRADVLAERRAMFGADWGLSVGGRWAVHAIAMQSLRTTFTTK